MEIVKMPSLTKLCQATGEQTGPGLAPSLDDPESMLPILIIGEK